MSLLFPFRSLVITRRSCKTVAIPFSLVSSSLGSLFLEFIVDFEGDEEMKQEKQFPFESCVFLSHVTSIFDRQPSH